MENKQYPYVAVGVNGTKVLFVKKDTGIVIEASDRSFTASIYPVGKYLNNYDEDYFFTPLSTFIVMCSKTGE